MGLTVIPEDDDAADCIAGGVGEPFRRRDRRHSMPTVVQPPLQLPQRLDIGRLSPKRAGDRTGGGGGDGTYYRDCHSHFLLDTEKPGHWCRMRLGGGGGVGRSAPFSSESLLPPPSDRRRQRGRRGEEGAGGEEGEEEEEDEEKDLALLTATESVHKRWQNPIECLSLTLEEVTHIRSVLTKAELESLVSHPDLYSQVSKNKVCFTCKTTRFSLFGEWGSRCKFCKRTVCSKCMRKMYMPTEQLKDVPVYTLSSTPLSQETLALVHNYVQSNAARRTSSPGGLSSGSGSGRLPPPSPPPPSLSFGGDFTKVKDTRPFLQRSQSLPGGGGGSGGVGGRRGGGPLTSICCDCKSMVAEILRASKSSLEALLPVLQSAGASAVLSDCSSSSPTSSSSAGTSASASSGC
ncbi:uncharacterized protein LOC143300548 [Babylonia areolata]|uniref:uncharacterized protein LOC143300548 n=1 Tax=Babylonia areolata TaxID=304850 RepID=UPI003FD0299D